ncbi:methionine adenosyltransferase, partial [Mycobacterium tuberculosis]|nr:methionine adenosyltransferase [Mycobacterium tuberculosis]
DLGFDAETCLILTDLRRQSPDIALGVSQGEALGAGDQGVFYGYACDETEELMPEAIVLAHRLVRHLTAARKEGRLAWLRPDGKSQVTLRCDADGRPVAVHGVVLSAQHAPQVDRETLVRGLVEEVVVPGLGRRFAGGIRLLINPTGRFVVGGPAGDTGLTGRKLMVDTYGGRGRHGGGAFSGKDPTKVDRSAAYMARWIAKTIVAAGLAARCEVAFAFAIGQREPEMVTVETFGTETADVERLTAAVREVFPLTVSGMIEALDLRRPVFAATAAYGHFGRADISFTWERTDRAVALRHPRRPWRAGHHPVPRRSD